MLKPFSYQMILNPGTQNYQEDYALIDSNAHAFCMADGIGNIQTGFECAKAACENVIDYICKSRPDPEITMPYIFKPHLPLAANILHNAIAHANRKIFEKKIDTACNCIAAILDDGIMHFGNIGSTNALLWRQKKRTPLFSPRTYQSLKSYTDENSIDKIPMAALGLYVDSDTEIRSLKVQKNDMIVLYSYGITNAIDTLPMEALSIEYVGKVLAEKYYQESACCILIHF